MGYTPLRAKGYKNLYPGRRRGIRALTDAELANVNGGYTGGLVSDLLDVVDNDLLSGNGGLLGGSGGLLGGNGGGLLGTGISISTRMGSYQKR